jgi:hypothetical protein
MTSTAVFLSLLICICCFGQAHAQVPLDPEEAEKLAVEASAAV